jgi:hypothetical protein
MAKSEKVNKSKAVRDYYQANSNASNKEISEALGKAGIRISPQHVANIKAKAKMKRKKRGRAAQQVAATTGVDIQQIKAAFGLLKLCGSTAAAKAALAAADDIKRVMM